MRRKAKEFLFGDWEGEYEAVKRDNGGKVPEYDPVMLEMCIKHGKCIDPSLYGTEGHMQYVHGG